ncbi:hypothetical protein [Oceaniradius stylonematis]|uniref:hypothetical protein n=1 Tax=Oceaniradius stylonematis TaxID=2184161 RepID=UPI00273D59BD|nr:hypothetical protein [Oceaniradius stylonematis]
MTAHMDTLRFAQHMRESGMDQKQAEALANGIGDYIVSDLVTKDDLRDALDRQTLRLTIRLGGLMIIGLGALAALIRLPAITL